MPVTLFPPIPIDEMRKILQSLREHLTAQFAAADAPESTDDMGYMVYGYMAKQLEHHRSLAALLDAGIGRDARLIARSMFETALILTWARSDLADQRASKWRAFAAIERKRRADDFVRIGKSVNAEFLGQLQSAVDSTGEMFWTAQAREATRTGRALPQNPHVREYPPRFMRETLNKFNGELVYGMYQEASGWMHSSALTFENDSLRIAIAGADYTIEDAIRSSLMIAFVATWGTGLQFEEHFFQQESEVLHNHFVVWSLLLASYDPAFARVQTT